MKTSADGAGGQRVGWLCVSETAASPALAPPLHSQSRGPFPQSFGFFYFSQDKMHWKVSGFTDPAGDRWRAENRTLKGEGSLTVVPDLALEHWQRDLVSPRLVAGGSFSVETNQSKRKVF